ncbi:hypothetical protein [Persicirhabdus sediminis]|uniref:Uncharacterized protein n=1 Tax=Persicirhabdus sediminis TaxID=454144 RepID=A0A8J7SK01_9BACT|nr:hypothetical protein [Persicirhabdus sediminis]MBK1790480.1 hypothetical protein [Persicirhabdus sediminis]
MSRISEHTHHLNVRETQMEMRTDSVVGRSALSEDFEAQLQEAQDRLVQLQQQQEEVERKRVELMELNRDKEEFLQGQVEITERLRTAVTSIDREVFVMRQELEELEQARVCFAGHLEKIESLDPESWANDNLRHELAKSISAIDLAEDEYEQAVEHFCDGRSASIFGLAAGKSSGRVIKPVVRSEFVQQFMNGLAFNLPMVVLAIIAALVYFMMP